MKVLLMMSVFLLGVVCKDKSMPDIVMIKLPYPIKTIFGNTTTKLQCHKEMELPLSTALQCIESRKERIINTGGCYCYRDIAGTSRLSKHALGMAIDINVGHPISKDVVDCFKLAGFYWGGSFSVPDPMHFELRN